MRGRKTRGEENVVDVVPDLGPPRPRLDPGLARRLLKKVPKPPPFPGVDGGETTVFAEQACPHCGGLHDRACPRVRRLVVNDVGRTVEVEFWAEGLWPARDVLWLADVQEAAAVGDGDDGVAG